MTGLFVQALQLCQKAGLVKLGYVSIDGTKIKADAIWHVAMSSERVDEAEDLQYGEGRRGNKLPEDLARREQEGQTGTETSGHDLRVPDLEPAKPDGKAQRKFTDPDGHIMVDEANKGSFIQACNAQAAGTAMRG